jgi:peroxiredoxin
MDRHDQILFYRIGRSMNLPSLFFLLVTSIGVAEAAELTPLKVGDRIPDVTLRTEADEVIKLREYVSSKPSVLIFYRGGWCPFCTRHLQAVAGIQGDIREAGAQLLAISMDQPSKLKETPGRDTLGYTLLSDSDAKAAQAFGIAFKVEDTLVARYKSSYNIDLEAASGRKHHLLPHPAVFVVDSAGTIRFAHINRDYKQRMDPAKILEAVKESGR